MHASKKNNNRPKVNNFIFLNVIITVIAIIIIISVINFLNNNTE